jgi:hypothetical protein
MFGDRTAVYSEPEDTYRYKLTIDLGSGKGSMLFIGLNPSTATEIDNDPTIERVERRARDMGYRALIVCNIFAYRATDPKDMLGVGNPAGGSTNLEIILDAAKNASLILCGWGCHGAHLEQGKYVEEHLRKNDLLLHSLGLNKDQSPKHPLYIGYQVKPGAWSDNEGRERGYYVEI